MAQRPENNTDGARQVIVQLHLHLCALSKSTSTLHVTFSWHRTSLTVRRGMSSLTVRRGIALYMSSHASLVITHSTAQHRPLHISFSWHRTSLTVRRGTLSHTARRSVALYMFLSAGVARHLQHGAVCCHKQHGAVSPFTRHSTARHRPLHAPCSRFINYNI
jgi:hypothetical protein